MIDDHEIPQYLDEMFGNKTKVKLLRAFFTYPERDSQKANLRG